MTDPDTSRFNPVVNEFMHGLMYDSGEGDYDVKLGIYADYIEEHHPERIKLCEYIRTHNHLYPVSLNELYGAGYPRMDFLVPPSEFRTFRKVFSTELTEQSCMNSSGSSFRANRILDVNADFISANLYMCISDTLDPDGPMHMSRTYALNDPRVGDQIYRVIAEKEIPSWAAYSDVVFNDNQLHRYGDSDCICVSGDVDVIPISCGTPRILFKTVPSRYVWYMSDGYAMQNSQMIAYSYKSVFGGRIDDYTYSYDTPRWKYTGAKPEGNKTLRIVEPLNFRDSKSLDR